MGKEGSEKETYSVFFTKEEFKEYFDFNYTSKTAVRISIKRYGDTKPYPVELERLQITDPDLAELDDGIILTVTEGVVVNVILDPCKETTKTVKVVFTKNFGLCKVTTPEFLTNEGELIKTDFYSSRLLSPEESLIYVNELGLKM